MSKFKGATPKKANFGRAAPPPSPVNPDRLPPQFSFEYMKDGSGYSVNCCDDEHRSALVSKMFVLSKKSWTDIKNTHRHGSGSEKIEKSSLKVTVPDSLSDDVTFLAIRYHGKNPIVGFRDGRIFHVLFIDHDFSAYDHS